MKSVDTIARIRREFFVRGKTIKEIVRELHVSRNEIAEAMWTLRCLVRQRAACMNKAWALANSC